MPTIYSVIPEMTEHIHDVIARQLTHKIINDLNPLTPIADKIYIDTGHTAPQQASDGSHNAVLRNNKVIARALPVTNPTSLKWDSLNMSHTTGQYIDKRDLGTKYPYVFVDPVAEVRLLEMSIPTHMAIEIEIELVSRDQAYEIPVQLWRRFAGGHVYTETVVYDYPLPQDIIIYLYSIYKMRKFDKAMTFAQYLKKGSNDLITANVPRAANSQDVELIIPKTNVYCNVQLDYNEDKPEEIKVGRSANAYQTKFVLNVQYTRADMMVIQFPAVIDNQIIPEIMVPKRSTDIPFRNLDAGYPGDEVDKGSRAFAIKPSATPIVLPYYDDWMIPRGLTYSRSYREFLIAGTLVEGPAMLSEIPLGGLIDEDGEYKLHDVVVKILKKQKQESFKTDCIFNIEVYANDVPIEPTHLELTDDLVLKFPGFNLSKRYRLVLSEITDVKYLNPKWYPDILENWPFFTISKQIADLINSGHIVVKDGTLIDPNHDTLGGLDGSYRPLRKIIGDIVPSRRS